MSEPQKDESFRCPSCKTHIPDAVVARYAARRVSGRRKEYRPGQGRIPVLSLKDRDRIRAERATGEKLEAIAGRYKVTKATVSHIVNMNGSYKKDRDHRPVDDCACGECLAYHREQERLRKLRGLLGAQ